MPRPFTDLAVKAACAAMLAAPQAKLMALRALIFREADAIGPHGPALA